VTNILIVSGTVIFVYDITIFGFAIAVMLFSVALYRMSVLDLAPVARQTAMEEMDDAVLTLDGEDRIVDCNGAARELFDISETEYFGQPVSDCCPEVLTETLDRYVDVDDVDTQIDLPYDGLERHFSLSISPIRAAEQADGRIVVLRDITPLKRREEDLESREEELDLLRQVFSRVLRHNLRNELTVIHGSADDLAERADPPLSDQAELICEASEDLLDISQKARYIEQIIDSDGGLVDRDLRSVATEAADAVRQRYPDAEIEVVGSDSCSVWCNPELDAAVENLIENAVEHNTTDPAVSVEISEADGLAQLTVADNGPGIEEDELVVLEEATETQLSHGSGIGLWLVKWVVDNSNANLAFETTQKGTDVTIRFERGTVPPKA
jgi:PAS domain S-box-containing protein